MEIKVLGPVEVWRAERSVYLARRQQRLILGILALEANRVVSSSRLIDLVWGERSPKQARAVIQTRISELRAALAEQLPDHEGQLLTKDSGYLLRIRPEAVDAHRFRQVVALARDATAFEDRRDLLRQALSLWRGPVLGGWLPADAHAALGHGLEAARLTAAEDLYDVELQLGRHQSIVDELHEMATVNPSRERLVAQAMLSLHRSSRTATALQLYDRSRRWLAEELGVDPGSDLQALHLALLRGAPELAPSGGQASGRTDTSPDMTARRSATAADLPDAFRIAIPGILPADIPDFTGRSKEIALLGDLLVHRTGNGVAVVAVAGPAGVGKTAVCVHAAYQLREAFPDGQLFANLQGVELDEPTPAFEVLGRFLRALGVDGSGVPSTLDDRVDLYRGLLAKRQVLVLLDNAATAEQVLPLIPGSPTCAVLINSRMRLGTAVGAETIGLEVLDPPQAVELLSRIAGVARIGAELEAASELARLCGYLPLAIRVAAAKLVVKPHWSVERLADRLGDERQRLDRLTYGHLDVRSSMALSYAGLSSDAQQLCRRLGDLDVPEVNVWASAALLDTTAAEAEEILEQLHDAQLLDIAGREPTGHTRYRLHDLVRLLAKERAVADERADELEAARTRALGAWLVMAEAVHRQVYGGDYMLISSPARRWEVETELLQALTADPLRWFDSERQAIVAMVHRAAGGGHSALCWGLACTTSPLFQMRYYYDEWAVVLEAAEAASRLTDDVLGRAAVLHRLAGLHADRREYQTALDQLGQAAQLFAQVGNRYGQAIVLANTASFERLRGNPQAALEGYQRALPELRGDYAGEAFTLRSIGQVHMELGDYPAADAHLDQALSLARARGSRRSEAQALFFQGMVRLKQQQYDQAQPLFIEALDLARALGDRPGEAQALRGLGLCHGGQGDRRAAAAALTAAIELVRQPRPTSIETRIRRELTEILKSSDSTSASP